MFIKDSGFRLGSSISRFVLLVETEKTSVSLIGGDCMVMKHRFIKGCLDLVTVIITTISAVWVDNSFSCGLREIILDCMTNSKSQLIVVEQLDNLCGVFDFSGFAISGVVSENKNR